MNQNLENYIKIYNKLDPNFCDSIIKQIEKSNWDKHNFYVSVDDNYYSNENDCMVTWNQITNQDVLHQLVWDSLYEYVVKDLQFEWFNGWQQFTGLRFNRYDYNTEMVNHCDHIHDIFDGVTKGVPVLSIVGILNDDFEGGDLMFFNNKKLDVKKGDIIIFPSNFLFPHKIEKITKGTRYSFVSWAW